MQGKEEPMVVSGISVFSFTGVVLRKMHLMGLMSWHRKAFKMMARMKAKLVSFDSTSDNGPSGCLFLSYRFCQYLPPPTKTNVA